MPFRPRKSVAVLCIALAVFAAIVPSADWFVPVAVLAPRWSVAPEHRSQPLAKDSLLAQEQLVSYWLLAPSRAPPFLPAS
jgi:hypothetical protein